MLQENTRQNGIIVGLGKRKSFLLEIFFSARNIVVIKETYKRRAVAQCYS